MRLKRRGTEYWKGWEVCGWNFWVPCFEAKTSICPSTRNKCPTVSTCVYIYIYWLMVGLVRIVSLWVLSITSDNFFFQNKSYNWWIVYCEPWIDYLWNLLWKKLKTKKKKSMSWLGNQTMNQCLDSNGLLTFQNAEWKWAMKSSRRCG